MDIVGANLYDRYLKKAIQNRENGNTADTNRDDLPVCRTIPKDLNLYEQTVESMESLLVGTGVYKHDEQKDESTDVYHGHRDIKHEPELTKPSRFVPDVYHGIQHILERENFSPCSVST